jgi:hypothetical protein
MRDTALLLALADTILALHLAVILFNIFGMIAIPLGASRGWSFVRVFWWRALHLGILAFVAVQAIFDQVCFLTTWHADLVRLAGGRASNAPLIAGFVSRLIFWPLPLWVFAALYVAVCAYTIALWRLVPPIYPGKHKRAT